MRKITFVAAADVGATNVRLAIVDSEGVIRSRHEAPLTHENPEQVTRGIAADLAQLLAASPEVHRIEAVGVSFAGRVDTVTGRVMTLDPSAALRWDGVPISEILSEGLGVDVWIDNDANAAALGEGWIGSAQGMSDYIFVAFGSAFGLGVVIDGRLHRGKHSCRAKCRFSQ